MKKILVTGGAGFVGRHIIERHLKLGNEVHCVDNLSLFTGAKDPINGWPLYNPKDYKTFHFYHEDCRDYFKKNSSTYFDYVFHLAAMVGGRLMIENNPLAVADDLSIDSEFWQWASTAKPKKTICFSSSAAYPIRLQQEKNYVLLSENMINLNQDIGIPDMSYGWAKITHEYLAKLAFEKHGINSVIYRPFSGYGEDQDDTYPFPSICKRILKDRGKDIIHVWGTGKQMRDFIHIEDCVNGIFQTMDKVHNCEALNLSTGIFTSFIEFAKKASNIVSFNPKIIGMSDKPAGVFARAGSTSKQELYGFCAQIDLQKGLERALQYYDNKL